MKDKDAAVITDDAVAVELSGLAKVKMVMGAYTNLKITTPEDIAIAKVILRG